MAQKNEAAYQWAGKLPITTYKLCQYSRKVFLGGVPWDSSENDLISAFTKFGYLSVMFPQKDPTGSMRHGASSNSLKGRYLESVGMDCISYYDYCRLLLHYFRIRRLSE